LPFRSGLSPSLQAKATLVLVTSIAEQSRANGNVSYGHSPTTNVGNPSALCEIVSNFINMKTKLIFLLTLLLFFTVQLKANDTKRKKFHLLISPFIAHTNVEESARKINSSGNIQFLYGITNNLYFGLNYSIGRTGERDLVFLPNNSGSTVRAYKYSTSKNSETISLAIQYFIWKNLYTSFNLGIEKGFTVERNNFYIIRYNNITPQPFSLKTVFADRVFGSIGLGIRQEIFSNFLLAFEYQRGYIESGKVNQHITYNPEYYGNNLPYLLEGYLVNNLINNNNNRNSQFQQFYFSAGMAF